MPTDVHDHDDLPDENERDHDYWLYDQTDLWDVLGREPTWDEYLTWCRLDALYADVLPMSSYRLRDIGGNLWIPEPPFAHFSWPPICPPGFWGGRGYEER